MLSRKSFGDPAPEFGDAVRGEQRVGVTMACSVTIRSVNGIVPAGQAAPDRVRVTGTATQCASGQILVTTSLTASATATLNPDGRYRIELPITAPFPQCGDDIGVRVECVGKTACFATRGVQPLECCTVTNLSFQAVRPAGSLTPTDLRVQGVLLGCDSDQVIISSTVTATTAPLPVDPYTGGFMAVVPITAPIQCDEKVRPGGRTLPMPGSGLLSASGAATGHDPSRSESPFRGSGGSGSIGLVPFGQRRKSGSQLCLMPGALLAGEPWRAGGVIHNEPRRRVFAHSRDSVHHCFNRREPR